MFAKSLSNLLSKLSTDDYTLDRIYDTVQLDKNETVLNFFEGRSNPSYNVANYEDNPAPSNKAIVFSHISAILMAQVIKDGDAGTDTKASDLMNSVANSYIHITQSEEDTTELRMPLIDICNFNGTSAASDTALIVKPAAVTPLKEPFVVLPGTRFKTKVVFASTTGFPATADKKTHLALRVAADVIKLDRSKAQELGFKA